MRISATISFPVILILIGINYLLYNMGVVSFTPWRTVIAFWPVILVYYGLRALYNYLVERKDRRITTNSELFFSLLLTAVGIYLLLPRFGYDLGLLSWSVIWPSILIILGITELVSRRGIFFGQSAKSHSSFIGEIHRGGESWFVEDMKIWHSIGEVHLDLTKAVIPNKEVRLDISGLVGEVVLYIPPDLPLKADCSLSIGDMTILDQHQDGFGRAIHVETPGYTNAERKINLRVHWKVGDVRVRRIG